MVSETQNARSELTSYNKRCIIFLNLLNLFLSWCVILLIVCGLCFMVSKQYFYLVIGSTILSLSIILLIIRLSLCCLKIEAATPETEAIEMSSPQEPNTSTSTQSQRENKVILTIFIMRGFNYNKNNHYLRIEANCLATHYRSKIQNQNVILLLSTHRI